ADHDHRRGPDEQGVSVRKCDGPCDHVDQGSIRRMCMTTHDTSAHTRRNESLPCTSVTTFTNILPKVAGCHTLLSHWAISLGYLIGLSHWAIPLAIQLGRRFTE